jgi:DNA mismatch repair ATPase MutS
LKIIVQDLNRYVAIAEEYPNDASCKMKSGGLLHDRKVARIITPGTLIDENFIDPFANNYILAIHLEDIPTPTEHDKMRNSVGLAWLDLSTGHFFTQSAELSMLSSIISRIGPREIILDKSLEYSQENGLRAVLAEDHHVISYCTAKDKKPMTEWGHMLESQISLSEAAKFKKEEVDAGGFLLEYVGSRLQGLSLRLQPPVRYQAMEVMGIDRNSVRALEIKETIKDGFSSGSLLHSLRRTVTKSGSRLLSDWLSRFLSILCSRCHLVNADAFQVHPQHRCKL